MPVYVCRATCAVPTAVRALVRSCMKADRPSRCIALQAEGTTFKASSGRPDAVHDQGLLFALEKVLRPFLKMYKRQRHWRAVLPWDATYLGIDVETCSDHLRVLVTRAFGTTQGECSMDALVEIVRLQQLALNPHLLDWTPAAADRARKAAESWRDMQVRRRFRAVNRWWSGSPVVCLAGHPHRCPYTMAQCTSTLCPFF